MATTSRKTGATKTSATRRSTLYGAAPDIEDVFVKPLKGMAERLSNLPLAGAAGAMLESGRKDLQALVEANEKSYAGLQTVVQRQTEMLKGAIVQWQQAVQGMSPTSPKENLAQFDAMGRAAFRQALDDIRELAELAARSQADAFEVVRKRIQSNVDEVGKLLKTPVK